MLANSLQSHSLAVAHTISGARQSVTALSASIASRFHARRQWAPLSGLVIYLLTTENKVVIALYSLRLLHQNQQSQCRCRIVTIPLGDLDELGPTA